MQAIWEAELKNDNQVAKTDKLNLISFYIYKADRTVWEMLTSPFVPWMLVFEHILQL